MTCRSLLLVVGAKEFEEEVVPGRAQSGASAVVGHPASCGPGLLDFAH